MMESLFLKWIHEMTYNIWLIFIVAWLAVMIKIIGKRISNLEKEHTKKPKLSYIAKRLKISKYLDVLVEDANGKKVSRMTWIRYLSRKMVVGNLKKTFPAFLQTCKKTEEIKETLRNELEFLYNTIFHDQQLKQKQQYYRALSFELKSRMLRNPFDLQNHRRCYTIESLFNDIWNKNNPTKIQTIITKFKKKAKYWSKLKEISSTCASYCLTCCQISRITKSLKGCWHYKSSGTPSKYTKFSICQTLLLVGLLTVGIICYDYYTDIVVLVVFSSVMFAFHQVSNFSSSENGTMKHESMSSLLGNIISAIPITNISNHDEVRPIQHELVTPVGILYCILIISTMMFFVADNPLKLFTRQIQTAIKMDSATVEDNNESINFQAIVLRYKLPITEAGTESGFQITMQWGIYFSISLLLSILTALEGSLHSDGLSTIDSELKFETLRLSSLASIASLSLAQVKANLVQNELNISCMQRILYFLACLVNTLSSVMLTTGLVTAVFDFLILSPVIHRIAGLVMQLLGLFIVCIYLMVPGHIATKLVTFPQLHILLGKPTYPLLQILQLPTSQYTIPGKGYLSYHTSIFRSPNLLKLIQNQFSAHILLIIPTVVFNTATSVLIEYHPTLIALSQTTNLTDFTPYSVSLARQNLMIHCFYGIPVGLLTSYFFLGLYFLYDNGYFSVANIEFNFERKDKTPSDEDQPNNLTNCAEAIASEKNDQNGDCYNEAWIEQGVEDDAKNRWYLRTGFGLPYCRYLRRCCKRLGERQSRKEIPDTAFEGVWMDLAGNNTEEELEEDNVEDSELLERVKSSFYYYKNVKEDEDETPV